MEDNIRSLAVPSCADPLSGHENVKADRADHPFCYLALSDTMISSGWTDTMTSSSIMEDATWSTP